MFTLDEGLGFNEIEQSYWLKAIKLNPWPLDEGPRPKSGKSRLTYMAAFWRENQLIQIKKGVQRRPHDSENQDAS